MHFCVHVFLYGLLICVCLKCMNQCLHMHVRVLQAYGFVCISVCVCTHGYIFENVCARVCICMSV